MRKRLITRKEIGVSIKFGWHSSQDTLTSNISNLKTCLIFTIAFTLTLTIGCKKLPSLGGGYHIEYSARGGYLDLEYLNNIVIGDDILKYAYNSKYILIEQKPVDSIPEKENYGEWQVIFNKSPFRQYWIIDKTIKPIFDIKDKTYLNICGPLKKSEFLKQRAKLRIPKTLILTDL